MSEPKTEKKVSKLQLSPSPSAKMPDWSQLPEELLRIVSENLENCFDVVHSRSVCSSWRSAFPFPAYLVRPSYSLPSLPLGNEDLCTLEKIPLFLFRDKTLAAVPASEYFLSGIGRDESEDHLEHPSPIQCSVKVKIPGSDSDPTLRNMLDFQILPLGHQYRMIGYDREAWTKNYRGAAFLPLNYGAGGEFAVLLNFTKVLLVFRSAEMRWLRLKKMSDATCKDLFAFRGRFYAIFFNGDVFTIDPYSLKVTPVMPLTPFPNSGSSENLFPSGDDELFLFEKIIPCDTEVLYLTRLACRVYKLDEEAGKCTEVSDLGDRMLFIADLGNVSCWAKELPDDCGVNGNSILFIYGPGLVTYPYKYGVDTGREEDDLNFWRFSREYRVKSLSTSPVVALRVESESIDAIVDT